MSKTLYGLVFVQTHDACLECACDFTVRYKAVPIEIKIHE